MSIAPADKLSKALSHAPFEALTLMTDLEAPYIALNDSWLHSSINVTLFVFGKTLFHASLTCPGNFEPLEA